MKIEHQTDERPGCNRAKESLEPSTHLLELYQAILTVNKEDLSASTDLLNLLQPHYDMLLARPDKALGGVIDAFESFAATERSNSALPAELRCKRLELELRQSLERGDPIEYQMTAGDKELLRYLRDHRLSQVSFNDLQAATARTAVRFGVGDLYHLGHLSPHSDDYLSLRNDLPERLSARAFELLGQAPQVAREALGLIGMLAEELSRDVPDELLTWKLISTITGSLRRAEIAVEGSSKQWNGFDPYTILHLQGPQADSILDEISALTSKRALDHSHPEKRQNALAKPYTVESLRGYLDEGGIFTILLDNGKIHGVELALPNHEALSPDARKLLMSTPMNERDSLYVQFVVFDDAPTRTAPQNAPLRYEALTQATADLALAMGMRGICGYVRVGEYENLAMPKHRNVGFEEFGEPAPIASGDSVYESVAVHRPTGEDLLRRSLKRTGNSSLS